MSLIIIFDPNTNPIESYEVISNVAFVTQILPVILYFINRKKIKDEVLRVIVFILSVGFFLDVANEYFISRNKSTYSITNTFVLIETLALLYFFHHIISNRIVKIVIILLSAFFSVFWLNAFVKYGTTTYLGILIALESIILIIVSVFYFFERIKVSDKNAFYLQPRFVVVTAYLIYTAGTFFVFLYVNNLSNDEKKEWLVLNSIFTVVKTVLLCIAMSMKNKDNERKKFELT